MREKKVCRRRFLNKREEKNIKWDKGEGIKCHICERRREREKGVKQMHQIHAFILAFDMHVAKTSNDFFFYLEKSLHKNADNANAPWNLYMSSSLYTNTLNTHLHPLKSFFCISCIISSTSEKFNTFSSLCFTLFFRGHSGNRKSLNV